MAANPVPEIYPHHDVVIQLVDGHAVPSIPSVMQVGDTVRYFSPAGDVTIIFPNDSPYDSPFLDDSGKAMTEIKGFQILKLQKAGDFFCRCFITLPSGQQIGWFEGEDPESGGDHHVGH